MNNIKLNIKLNYIKLKKSFLEKGKKVTVFDCDYI
jgi:hypothetical protein